ncbi:MAG TPA: signal peptidase I [Methanocorpusculum sp.]|nr:signal peptidase I [Methanocorpusculum sp.]
MSLSKPKIPESKNPIINFIRDILIILIIVAIIGAVLFGISGTWPALVAVESGSMIPNMNVGDLIFVVEENRYGGYVTAVEAASSGKISFGGYGDVIVYQPNGETGVTPIIHRAITWMNESAAQQEGFTGDAAHAGYMTKGDNNDLYDQNQNAIFADYGRIQPVKEEWIIGKALFAIPLIGFVPLHIFETALIVIIILVMIEFIGRVLKKNKKTKKITDMKR